MNSHYDTATMYHDGNSFITKIPSQGEHGRFYSENDQSIEENYSSPLAVYREYLKKNNLENGEFSELLKEYENTKFEESNLVFVDYLEYLLKNGKIKDRKLYSHILKVLDFMVLENNLHPEFKKRILDVLNKQLYSENMKNVDEVDYKYKKIDYSNFYDYNSKKVNNNQVLNELYSNGGELYRNKKGKFCLKQSKYDTLTVDTKKIIEGLLSGYFGFNIRITDEVILYQDIDLDGFMFKGNIIGVPDVE